MNTLLHDIRYGVRMLLKHKGFTAFAMFALGLGIGANTAIFSLVNGVLLRPLPFPNSERIVYFEGKNPAAGITDSNISYLDFTEWSQQTDVFASTAAYWVGTADLSGNGAEPEAVPRAGVTPGFFSVLGVQPVLGRAILPEDDRPASFNEGRGIVAIISHGSPRINYRFPITFGGSPKQASSGERSPRRPGDRILRSQTSALPIPCALRGSPQRKV